MRDTGIYTQKPEGSFSYRAAALIIKNNMLLVAKSTDYPCYYTVGGVVEIHETSEEAVIREVYEETGCNLEIDRLAYVQERFLQIDGQKLHEVVFFYIMKTPDDIEVFENSHTDQTQETLHWLPIDNLRNINIVPSFLRAKNFDDNSTIEHIITRE